jgi:hypothetical protein
MKRFVAAAGLLVLGAIATPVSASDLCELLQPCRAPAKYASGTFLAKPDVREVGMDVVRARCNDVHVAAGEGALGCASFEGDRRVVIVPAAVKKISPGLFRLLVEHELAHCRGWVH